MKDKTYTLGEVWTSMQGSDDLLLQLAGILNEMLNTASNMLFFWFFGFLFVIPFFVSKFFPKREQLVFLLVFVLSFYIMNTISRWTNSKTMNHWEKMQKDSSKEVGLKS